MTTLAGPTWHFGPEAPQGPRVLVLGDRLPDRTGHVDLDHWLTVDGGEPIDGPTPIGDEPGGDAMRWTPPQEDHRD